MRHPALDAWGDYDRDDPFPLFAQVRADGPVHEVTLADGHRAWLIVGHDEAKAALNDPGLSKDMHAALAHDGGGGRRGPARPRLRPAHAQRRPARPHPAAPAGLGRVQPTAGHRPSAAGPGDRRRPARRPPGARRHRRRPGRGLRLPAAVHRDQRAARRPGTRPRHLGELVHHAACAVVGARATGRGRRGLRQHRAAT